MHWPVGLSPCPLLLRAAVLIRPESSVVQPQPFGFPAFREAES
jgi:hypothetical protein